MPREVTVVPKLTNLANTKLKHLSEKNRSILARAHSFDNLNLGRYSLTEIQTLTNSIERWMENVNSLLQQDAFQNLSKQQHLSLKNIKYLASFSLKPRDPPSSYKLFSHRAHGYSEAPKVFSLAKSRANEFASRMQEHSDYLDLDTFPCTQTNYQLLSVVTGRTSSTLFSLKRRRAWEKIKQASISTQSIRDKKIRSQLEKLYALYGQMLGYNENKIYRNILGPGFIGISSDWNEIKVQIRFSQAINKTCPTRSLTSRLIKNWETESISFLKASKKAASVLADIYKLNKLPMLGLKKNNNQQQSILEVLTENATVVIDTINQNLEVISDGYSDKQQTPKSIIESLY